MRRSLEALILLVVTFFVPTERLSAEGVQGGFKAGLNLADVVGGASDVFERTTKVAYAAGGFVRFPLNDTFSIQPEVLFTMKGNGADTSAFSEDGDLDIEFKQNYIEVPLLLAIDLGQGKVRPVLLVGPYMARRLDSKVVFRSQGESSESDVEEDFRDFDFGLIVGGGLELGRVMIEARYGRTVTRIDKLSSLPGLRNSVFSFMAGVSF